MYAYTKDPQEGGIDTGRNDIANDQGQISQGKPIHLDRGQESAEIVMSWHWQGVVNSKGHGKEQDACVLGLETRPLGPHPSVPSGAVTRRR